jgi:GDP-4-dehydro-6-deoxy-D-mannose reductase
MSPYFAGVHQLDVRDEEAVRNLIGEILPVQIYHLAAQSSSHVSFTKPWLTLETNIRGTLNIFEAVRQLGLNETRIINTSSAVVYGMVQPEDLPLKESHSFNPGSPYDVSKIAQDLLGAQYAKAYDMPIVSARAFNHTGAGQDEHFALPNFALQIARIERGLAEPILRVGNLAAERDYLDVRDVVRAYVALAEKGKAGQVYNICNGHSHSMQSFVGKLIQMARIKIQIEVDQTRFRPIDLPRLVGENSALRKATGWKPYFSMDEMLESVLEDCRARVANAQ